MQKHELDKFYIGELNVGYAFNSLLSSPKLTKEQLKSIDTKKTLILNGAIPFEKGLLKKNIDWGNHLEYERFLTIFYKNNNDYICLHDSNIYKDEKSKIYCDNLIPLKRVLPKVSYKIPEKLSINTALNIFKKLYKENDLFNRTLYNNKKLPIDKFEVGTLKFKSSISNQNIHIYQDIPMQYLLFNNDAKLTTFNSCYCDTEYLEYDYIMFKCLLLNQDDILINLHNNQIYNKINIKKISVLTDSYYKDTIPFKKYLEDKNIKYNKDEISVPKALKLYKK